MIKWCLVCVCVCSTFSVKATDARFADSLFAAGNFSAAGLEYERIVYQDTNIISVTNALLKKSYCYRAENNFSEAYQTLSRVNCDKLTDSLHYQIRYERTLNAYLACEYQNAEFELVQMDFFIRDTLLTQRALFLKILVLSERENWEQTKFNLNKYFALHHIRTDTINFDELLPTRKIKSPKKARILSLFIPGLGQAYSGYPGRAVSSLLLQGAAAAFTVVSIMNGFYIEGISVGAIYFLRFYTGGARYAGQLAVKHNSKKNIEAKLKIKNRILAFEQGK